MMWLLLLPLSLLAAVVAACYAIDDVCRNEIAVFARRVDTCKTMTEIVRLEADINLFKHSQCWFARNHERCDVLIRRLRRMRTAAEFQHR